MEKRENRFHCGSATFKICNYGQLVVFAICQMDRLVMTAPVGNIKLLQAPCWCLEIVTVSSAESKYFAC